MIAVKTVSELYHAVFLSLQNGGIDEAAVEARLIVNCAVERNDTFPCRTSQLDVTEFQTEQAAAMTERRLKREPLQYILGSWSFMGYEFKVTPAVLIPRQDTETLVERALELAKEFHYHRILDVCTGSGCIGISTAKMLGPGLVNLTLSDLSPEALLIAKENADRLGVSARCLEGNLFETVLGEQFDMILINPPYLNAHEMESLQAELVFEPAMALDGGTDGLGFYQRIASEYDTYLRDGGTLLLEIGYTQAETVSKLFDHAIVHYDLGGNPRVVEVRKGF